MERMLQSNSLKSKIMKTFFNVILLLIVFQFSSCKEDSGEESSSQLKMLTATTWANAQVVHDDGDLSDQYTNFAIAFTDNSSSGFDGTFVVSNGGYAFAENSGRWKFNDDFTQIIFDSGKEMDVELSEEHLRLEFTVATEGGKLNGTSGNFTFDLQPL
jgi:hypothetical protein